MDNLLVILIIVAIIIGYIAIMTYLQRRKVLEKYNMSSWYGIVMWRTGRGQKFVDLLAKPKRFWHFFGYLAKAICLFVMIAIMALLIWEASLVTNIPAEQAPTLDMLIGLPGVNPLIPLWYGILALAVGVAVHEIGHGIMSRVAGMKIKSMGLLMFIFPIGAFVEPDEEALVKADKKTRTSVYAAGPATNIVLALFCAFLFSSVMVSSAEVANDGPVIGTVYGGSPADLAGLESGYQIVSINGVEVSYADLYDLDAPAPGSPMSLRYYFNGQEFDTTVSSGIVVLSLSEGLPAADSGLRAGMILYSINGTVLYNEADFRSVLNELTPGETYEITAMEYDQVSSSYIVSDDVTNITPANRADYVMGGANMAYLGVTSQYLGAGIMDPQAILDRMASPYANAESMGDYFSATLQYIALPFTGLQPLDGVYRDIFVPSGIFAGWDNDVFWVTANCFYWIFWLSLMLGMTNALPAVPLDGGFLFRDWIDSIVKKVKKGLSEEERERVVSSISYTFILLVVFLIAWQLIGPRLF